jgi:hypothetical protein
MKFADKLRNNPFNVYALRARDRPLLAKALRTIKVIMTMLNCKRFCTSNFKGGIQ